MGVIALYDVTGIQEFIFSSNKLKEIIGGSLLVRDILQETLPKVIKDCLHDRPDHLFSEWQPTDGEAPKFEFLNDPKIEAEILYIGGGNAWVAYRDEKLYLEVNRKLSLKIMEMTYLLRVVSVGIKTDFEGTYKADMDLAQTRLKEQKRSIINSMPRAGLSITTQSVVTGQPVVAIDSEEGHELLSTLQYLKRQKYNLLTPTEKGEIRDFEDFAQKGKESILGVIHADGNNMGILIQTYMSKYESYEDAIPAMRLLSSELQKYFKKAVSETKDLLKRNAKELFTELNENLNNNDDLDSKDDALKKEKLKKEAAAKKEKLTSIREIVLEGDDISIVCNGRVALSFACRLLEYMKKHELFEDNDLKKIELSACAGVCLFHSHFPFSHAYDMAEECCSRAKLRGRSGFILSDNKANSGKEILEMTHGSWIDFHLNDTNSLSSVDEYREKMNRGDAEKAKNMQISGRPYCVAPLSRDNHELVEQIKQEEMSRFDNLFLRWAKAPEAGAPRTKSWAHGKLKLLRDAISLDGDPEEVIKHVTSFGYEKNELPSFGSLPAGADEAKIIAAAGTHSVFFDVLEMADLYERLSDWEVKA